MSVRLIASELVKITSGNLYFPLDLRRVGLLFVFLAITCWSGAQDTKTLEDQKHRLEKEIAFTRKKISELNDQKSNSLNELRTLKKQLSVRRELISTISAQVDLLDEQIDESRGLVKSLEKDVQSLKHKYAQMIRHSYMNHDPNSELLFVFSSESFNGMIKRARYLKAYADFRKEQASLIVKTKESIEEELKQLEVKKQEKLLLLESNEKHKQELANEEKQLHGMLGHFKEKEGEYLKEIRKKEDEKARIGKQIEKMLAAARRAAEKKQSGEKNKIKALELTKEAAELSANFVGNKGKLPWPVESGTIIRAFGKRPHEMLSKLTVENNGVDISTEKNADVRCIFSGEVMYTFYNPTVKNGLIIMHGEYFTVYTGLRELKVKEGDKVETKETLGSAYTDESTANTEIHLEIWKGQNKLNPALWLMK